jgi:DNA relaxase NicK
VKQHLSNLIQPTFDWYQASTQTNIKLLLEIFGPLQIEEKFHAENPKLKGYKWAYKLGGRGGSCLIHYGGKNGDDHGANFAGTGPMAVEVAKLFRATELPHQVGRADVRQDALAEWSTWRTAFIERCNSAGMATRDHGSCPESIKQLGRTVYGGAKSSSYQPTIYEKGLQLGQDYPSNYLRLEHRFSFSKAHEKQTLSTLTPSQMVGLRPVARDLSNTLVGLSLAPYKLDKLPKVDSPYLWMLRQYGKVLREMIDDLGASAVGHQIQEDLKSISIEYMQ